MDVSVKKKEIVQLSTKHALCKTVEFAKIVEMHQTAFRHQMFLLCLFALIPSL